MATNKAQAIFLDTLVERCESFVAETRIVNALDYPSKAPKILAACLFKAAERIRSRAGELRQAYEQTNQIPPLDEMQTEASNIYAFLVFNSSYICPMLRNASITNVPAEMVLPMETIARLVFPDCQIVIGGVSELNYYFLEIGEGILQMFSSVDLDDVLQGERLPSQLFRLQVCLNPPCGILLHCLLGHEIGHAIYKNKQISSKILPHLSYKQRAFKELVDVRLQQLMGEFSRGSGQTPTQLILEQTREFAEYVTRMQVFTIASYWIEELFCDIIGTGLFGPAFICASSMFLLPFSQIDETSDTHPSSKLRIQWSINALERNDPGFGYKHLREDSGEVALELLIQPWKQLVGTKATIPRDAVHKVVFDTVIKVRGKVIEEAKSALGAHFFRPSYFKKEVYPLRERLRNWLPPNEYQMTAGNPFTIASLQGIFNAGWLSYVEDMPYFVSLFKERLSENEIRSRFYGLVSKGIESSQIQLRWQNAKDNLR